MTCGEIQYMTINKSDDLLLVGVYPEELKIFQINLATEVLGSAKLNFLVLN